MVIDRSRVRRSTLLALVIVLVGGACARDKAAPAASTATGATASASASSAVPLDLVPLPPDTAAGELRQFRLTIPVLERWAKTQTALNTVAAAHPEVLLNLQRNTQIKTVDQMIAVFAKQPQIRGALDATHMSAHEYLITMITMQTAWEGYAKSAGGTPLPADLPPALVENIAFLRANMPAVQHVLGTIRNNPRPATPPAANR